MAGMYGWMSMQEKEFDELWVGLTNKDFSLTLLRLLRQICIGAVYSWHVVVEKSSELIVVEVEGRLCTCYAVHPRQDKSRWKIKDL